MKRFFALSSLIIGVVIMLSNCGRQENPKAENNPKYPPLDVKNMDATVKPGDDFFEYANGGWIKAHPIPPEYARYGSFDEIQERKEKQLKTIVLEAAAKKNAPKGSLEQLIGDFYASGMDTAKIEKDGLTPLKPELELIDKIADRKALLKEIARLNLYGIYPGFIFYAAPDEKNSSMTIANLYQGGLGLGDKDFYLSDDARSKQLRTEYVKHARNIFKLMGYKTEEADAAAKKIMELETNLAKVSRSRVDLRDPLANYNKMPLEKCQKLTPNFDWNEYLSQIGVKIDEINVGQPDFLKGYDAQFAETPLETWKEYLKWNLISATAGNLSSDFEKEHFHFYGTVFSGKKKQKERWKRVLAETSGSLGEAVGRLYVRKYFPPSAKARMLELVGNLKKSLADRIKNLSWMSDETKAKALEKLNAMNVKVGYPDKWIDYSKVDISRDSYLRNALNAAKFNVRRELNKIGKPVDRKEWGMTPQTINAYYSPNMNEIVFPAAILQPPFFNQDADDAVNYGAIGSVIGHEMTHGFDDQGRMYDKDGNLNNWQTKEDAEKFKKQAEVLVEQYDSYYPIDSMHINGKLTLGENIADLGGVTISYHAWEMASKGKELKPIDGFTPRQRFFLSYAQVWRQNIRPEELMRRLKLDVHSPARFRVNGVVRNVPQFYEAFDVKKGDKLYLPEDKRAKIW